LLGVAENSRRGMPGISSCALMRHPSPCPSP
jgi:hypothetical protein